MGGDNVDIESLGRFESDQEENLFYFSQAFENLQQASDSISNATLNYEIIDEKYRTVPLKPSITEVNNIMSYLFENKETYRNMINLMLEDLQLMNYDDMESFISQFYDNNGELDVDKLIEYYEQDEKTFLKAILTMSISSDSRLFAVFNALVIHKMPNIDQYISQGAAKGSKALLNKLFKSIFSTSADDLPVQSAELAGSTILSHGYIAASTILAIVYASASEGVDLYSKSQYGDLTAEDWGWAIASVGVSGGIAFGSAVLYAAGATGPWGILVAAGGIVIGFIFNGLRTYFTGSGEIGHTSIRRNGIIFDDDFIAEYTGELDKKDGMWSLRDLDNNIITVDKETARSIIAEDWRSYIRVDILDDESIQALDEFIKATTSNPNLTDEEYHLLSTQFTSKLTKDDYTRYIFTQIADNIGISLLCDD